MGMEKSKEEVAGLLREFVIKQFPIAGRRRVDINDSLLDLGVVDSLGVLEIVTFIEQEFNVTLTDDELMLDHFESIHSIAELVHRKLSSEGSVWIS